MIVRKKDENIYFSKYCNNFLEKSMTSKQFNTGDDSRKA